MKTNIIKKTAALMLSGTLLFSTAFPSALVSEAAGSKTRVSVHDPSIVKDGDSYFIIGSHLGAARSSDLQNWSSAANSNLGTKNTTFFNDIYKDLAVPEKWSNTSTDYDLSGNLWAPDIIWNPDMKKYCMYLSVNGVDWHSSIVLCTADNIEGPYSYSGTVVYSGFETNPANTANNYKNTDVQKVLGSSPDLSRYLNSSGRWNAEYGTNAIDPCTFYDENGALWMVYGSWFGGIYMLELDEKTGLRDYNVTYKTKSSGGTVQSDAYMGVHVAGGHWVSGEGPYIEYMKSPDSDKGYYYLFLSYGYFNNKGGYNMRIFRSENPQGPYVDQNGNSAIFSASADNIAGNIGERLMSNYQWSCNSKPNTAQGHNSALMDSDGKLYCIYHNKFDDNYGGHEVRVHQMIMNEDGWPTATSYEYSGESLSKNGHTLDAIVGDYELIWHNPNQKFENEKSADVEKPINITLNSDGSVTGDISAEWKITKTGTPYMSFTWGGVTYKGAFLVQEDESDAHVKKMTFTATGINICIWGSKKTEYDRTEDIVDVKPVKDGTYTIKNVNSELFISAVNGSAVQKTTPVVWTVKADDEGWYSISSDNKYLTVSDSNAANGTDIVLDDYKNNDSQKFRIIDEGNGQYALLTAVSGAKSGVDVYGISKEDGANICQWEYWGGDGQKFTFEAKQAVQNGTLIKDLIVYDTENAYDWSIQSGFSGGSLLFGDREFTCTSLPSILDGTEYIRTACDSKLSTADLAELRAGKDMTVYVAIDTRVSPLPEWLSSWTDTGTSLSTSNDLTMKIYSKALKSDDKLILGTNGGLKSTVNYVVLAKETASSSTTVYPIVNSIEYSTQYHQFRITWTAVPNAQAYGIAYYSAGKWRPYIQNISPATTTWTSPKLQAGKSYTMVIAAKVGGKWDINKLTARSVTVTVK